MASKFFLEGKMVSRNSQRTIDERDEPRQPSASSTAALDYCGRRHVVRVANVSKSGAMVIFRHQPNIGECLSLQLLDRGNVPAQVIWVKDGHIGLSFDLPASESLDFNTPALGRRV